MSNLNFQMAQLSMKLRDCSKAFTALGDETRQQILLTLLEHGEKGMRVGELTECTHLSRPAVSHHLQILKSANIINMYRRGTKNFYFLDADNTQWKKIEDLASHVNELIELANDWNWPATEDEE